MLPPIKVTVETAHIATKIHHKGRIRSHSASLEFNKFLKETGGFLLTMLVSVPNYSRSLGRSVLPWHSDSDPGACFDAHGLPGLSMMQGYSNEMLSYEAT